MELILNAKQMNNNNFVSAILWPCTLIMTWFSTIDRSTITFIMGTAVSLLAVIHYVVQIRKNLKEKNEASK